jgi:tetratricopeptide (TPR) repeat protein
VNTLCIKHVPGDAAADAAGAGRAESFFIARPDGRATRPGDVPSPAGYPVPNRPDSSLLRELRWYLEEFLDYPFPPYTDRAAHMMTALRAWGREAFNALFEGRDQLQLFETAVAGGHHRLQLQVWSDDPEILGWPWEALVDPQTGFLAHVSAIERRLNTVRDPNPLSDALPRDRINILLVTARPYERDVRYRSISRPLVELVRREGLRAHVHLLRPPTFDRLREHLQERPGFYHVLHFDGHGAYGPAQAGAGAWVANQHLFHAIEGRLIFEGPDGKPDAIAAETLSVLLREHAVPAVVLNACQSAMVDSRAADPFASVATALLRSGVRSVTAMAYSLYVSAAQEFLPAFYRRLFEKGDMAEGVRAGRQRLLTHKKRTSPRGKFELEDWLVPVIYQQDRLDLTFANTPAQKAAQPTNQLPAATRDEPFGFIGRDGELLALERALRGPVAGILINGLGGSGKTTLARGLVEWLTVTEGLERGCWWFNFQDIRSAEYIFNQIGEALFGGQFATISSLEAKATRIAEELRPHHALIVWDNFEVAAGGGGMTGTLSSEDLASLLFFLRHLRGGATKVVITSRSEETWLGIERRKVPLGGLDGEERWEFCDRILESLGISVDRNNEDIAKLMALLGGHPLSMRAILPELEKRSAADLAAALRTNLTQLRDQNDAQAKILATLRYVEQSLPTDLRALLIPLGLHERHVDADYLEFIAKQAPGRWQRSQVDEFCRALVSAGLLQDRGQSIYEMHPALTGYLRSTLVTRADSNVINAWTVAFVNVMAALAASLAPKPLHDQRFNFQIHGASFHSALKEAERLSRLDAAAALMYSLAIFALNTRAFREAHDLFSRLEVLGQKSENAQILISAYHQLGIIAQEQRDFEAANRWYRKALVLAEEHGDERSAAGTYHQLGIIAQEQQDLGAAEAWYRKSLAIEKKLSNEPGVAISYHHLGVIAQQQRDFGSAAMWYRESLAIEEKLGNELGVALCYHQLGMVAQEQRDFGAAEVWYRKSLAIQEQQGNEHGAASTYHQLGVIAQERRNFDAAEVWYRKSLAIEEKQGNEHGAAATYHHLGMVAQEQRDCAAAEAWYRKSLAIKEKQGNEHGASTTYHHLGMVAQEQREFAAAEAWYRKSLAIKEKLGNEHGASLTCHQLGLLAQVQRDFDAATAWYRKSLAVKEKQGDEHGAASTYHQLGRLAEEQRDFEAAGQAYIQAIRRFLATASPHNLAIAARSFLRLLSAASESEQTQLRDAWRDAGLGPLPSIDETKS